MDCFTSYSVTVNTVFHNTKIDLSKWLAAIFIYTNSPEIITVRSLSRKIRVSKNTALSIINKIKGATEKDLMLFSEIANNKKIEKIVETIDSMENQD